MKLAKAFAAISLFLLLAASGLHAACSSATAVGTFGFTTTGTLILPTGPAPVAAVGLVTFDLNAHRHLQRHPCLHDHRGRKRLRQLREPGAYLDDPGRAGQQRQANSRDFRDCRAAQRTESSFGPDARS